MRRLAPYAKSLNPGQGTTQGDNTPESIGIDLLKWVTSTRATVRTVWGKASNAVYTDPDVLITVPIGYPAIEGGRLATTVVDGAVLGSEILANGGFDADTVWSKVACVIEDGLAKFIGNGLVYIASAVTTGKKYNITIDVDTFAGTSISVGFGGAPIPTGISSTGVFTVELVANGSGIYLYSSIAGNWINSISLKEVIPTWYKTDRTGYPLTTTLSNEDSATNYLLNSSAPVTQTTASLGTGFYTLSVYGTGSALASGGTATITGAASATDGSPNTIQVTVAGTVTVTVTGLLDYSQLEGGSYASSIIITAGTTITRAADINTVPVFSGHTVDSGAERLQFTPTLTGQVDKYLRSFYIDATHTIDLYVNATQVIAYYIDGANTSSAVFTYTHTDGEDAVADWYWDSALNTLAVRAAAVSGDIDGETFATGTFAGMTAMPSTSYIGCKNEISQFQGTFGDPIEYSSALKAGFV